MTGDQDMLREAEAALAGMIRLSEMGFEASMREPEENGNFAAYERAKRAHANIAAALSAQRDTSGAVGSSTMSNDETRAAAGAIYDAALLEEASETGPHAPGFARRSAIRAMLAFANPPAADVSDVAGLREAASAAREILAGVGAKIDSGECASAITPKIGGKRYVVMPFETYEGDLIRRFERGKAAALAHNPAPAAASVGEGMREAISVTDDLVQYIQRWGGSCRDCADEDGFCPRSGIGCGESGKAIRWVLGALNYGLPHRYITAREAAGVDGGASVVVPREPTEAMVEAGFDYLLAHREKSWVRIAAECYRRMIAAAPIAQPAEEEA